LWKKRYTKTNAKAWCEKIRRTKVRDRESMRRLRKLGWKVIRIWECRLLKNGVKCVDQIRQLLGNDAPERP